MPADNPPDELYRAFFEKNPAIKLLIDPQDGSIIDANAAACAFYGYTREQLRAMRISDINQLPPEEVRACMTDARAEARSEFVFPHRLASGEVRTVRVLSGPIPFRGRTLLFSIVHDVTEQQRLRRELDRFFELSPDVLCVIDEAGCIERCNPALAETLGYSPAALRGRMIIDFVHPDDQDLTRREMQRRRSSGVPTTTFENRFVGRDGTVCRLAWTASWDAQQRRVYAAARDVTQDRETMAALRRSRESLAAAQKIAHLGNWDWVIGSEQADWSDEVYRIFGMQPPGDGATISLGAFVERIHPDDREPVLAEMRTVADKPGPFEMVYRIIRPDGEQRVVHSRGDVTRASDGSARRMIGTVLDVTERVRASEELEQQRLTLESVLNASNDGVCACRALRDETGRIVDFEITLANAAAERLAGRSTGELVGSTVLRTFPGAKGRACSRTSRASSSPPGPWIASCPTSMRTSANGCAS